MNQFEAAEEGNLQVLRDALTTNNAHVNDVDDVGRTVLINAAESGHVDCVKLCIELGANLSARDISGWTSLHWASVNGHKKVACLLLDVGARIDAKTNGGKTSLYWAICNNHIDNAKTLIDRGAKISIVQRDKHLPTIPNWITTFIASRSQCRNVTVIIIDIHKYHRTDITGNNDINVIKLISKHIWSMRVSDNWVNVPATPNATTTTTTPIAIRSRNCHVM
jgi:ankyrin repeat protein